MRAAVFHGAQDVRIEDVEEPYALPGQVKLRNAHVGVCGSDLHIYYDPANAGVDYSAPHPLTGAMPPLILGHEFSGTVVEVGDGVDELCIGDRVAVWPIVHCGTCRACQLGLFNVCKQVAFEGVNGTAAGLSTYTTVSARQCHRLPDSVDLRLGALVEPMAVGWHAARRSGITADRSALIIGGGPIGISLLYALRARGVERVYVSEPAAARRSTIAGMGVTAAVDPTAEDLTAWVMARTGGNGVDYVFDAAGVAPALSQGLTLIAPGGTVVIVGIHSQEISIHPVSLVLGEITLLGCLAYAQRDFDEVIEAMATGIYDTTGWVEDVPFEEFVPTIIRLHGGEGVKVLVTVGDE